ncbi:uncharacterized protein LOC116412219 isoform X2 [Xenopus tropicalis]|uniref:Uncharacterized protein LOC116412219 isoform X2 n=1 Tax=Xenopus tropicalis TaxID=8364 RepID=A0A8J1JVA1_XENTR|nr:uncharacterized protein LOC116412219 isoform X2 [Xenopus tropicalis]
MPFIHGDSVSAVAGIYDSNRSVGKGASLTNGIVAKSLELDCWRTGRGPSRGKAGKGPSHLRAGTRKIGTYTHPYQPGDIVLVRRLHPKKGGTTPYGDPTTVIAITRTTVLTSDSNQWIHAMCLKRASGKVTPQDTPSLDDGDCPLWPHLVLAPGNSGHICKILVLGGFVYFIIFLSTMCAYHPEELPWSYGQSPHRPNGNITVHGTGCS